MMVGGIADRFPEHSILITFKKFLVLTCKVPSIKQTKETTENGTYKIILSDKDYDNFTKHLKKLFSVFRQNSGHKVIKEAKDQYKYTPCIKLLFSNNELESKVNDLQ